MRTNIIRDIFKINIAAGTGEAILVFTDTFDKGIPPKERQRRAALIDIADDFASVGREITGNCNLLVYPQTGTHGTEPPIEVWEAAFSRDAVVELSKDGLLSRIMDKTASIDDLGDAGAITARYVEKAVKIVIAVSNFSTSHTRFRDLLTRVCGTRYASMPLFDAGMFDGAMGVDYERLRVVSERLATSVQSAQRVRVTTPYGTDIVFTIGDRRVMSDDGDLRKRGAFGNLPAGEVYFAPMEGKTEGTMVLQWAPTRRLDSEIRLTVRDGRVVKVDGDESYTDIIKAKLAERADNANIAELGIGTNDKARNPANILEAEKILGTIHIALGDNSSMGGLVKTPYHQDFVFFYPDIILDDKTTIMKDGKLL